MWDYWFEGIVIFMLLGISARVFLLARHLDEVHDCLHNFEERAFDPEQVHIHEWSNLRVMGLEDFMDEFGFDPRNEALDEEEPSNTAAIEAWDNAKL